VLFISLFLFLLLVWLVGWFLYFYFWSNQFSKKKKDKPQAQFLFDETKKKCLHVAFIPKQKKKAQRIEGPGTTTTISLIL